MKKLIISAVLTLILLGAACPGALAANEITQGVDIIRRKTEMIKTTEAGGEILFEPEEFDKAFGIGKVEFIIITELPSSEEGILKLGGTDIEVGQGISRANIPLIEFIPINKDVKEGHFAFKCWGKPMNVRISITDGVSLQAPTAYDMKLDAYSGIACSAAMCSDGGFRYEIVSAPSHGYLRLIDATSGNFVFKPLSGYTGADSFCFRSIGKNGCVSDTARIDIRISEAPVLMSDMQDSENHTAAVFLAALGAADYSCENGGCLFNSKSTMTRGGFAYMLNSAMDIKNDDNETVFFSDSSDNSREAIAVRTACANGIMTSLLTENGRTAGAKQCISVRDAYSVIENLLVGEYPETCILHRLYGNDGTKDELTKEKAAALIYSAYRIDKGQTNIKEIFN